MQTGINYDQVYTRNLTATNPKMLMHYLVKLTSVKQVTLNVTDIDKINIVSSQVVLEVSSFSTNTRSNFSSPLVSSLVKNRLFKTAPGIDDLPFQFIHTMDLSLVDTTLHDSPLLLQLFQVTLS